MNIDEEKESKESLEAQNRIMVGLILQMSQESACACDDTLKSRVNRLIGHHEGHLIQLKYEHEERTQNLEARKAMGQGDRYLPAWMCAQEEICRVSILIDMLKTMLVSDDFIRSY